MPVIFVILIAAAIAGMYNQSPSLKTATPRALTAAYRFINRRLRFLIAICAVWTIVLILVSLIGNTRTIVLILTFIPVAAALYAALAIPPAIWLAPLVANAALGGIGKILTGLVSTLPKRFRASMDIPEFPEMKSLLWPAAAGLIANCVLGLFLYFVPITNDRELLFILLIISIPLALLQLFGKARGLQRLLRFAAMVIVIIFFLGGRGSAAKKIEGQVTKLMSSGAPVLPASYREAQMCPSTKRAPVDLFGKTATDISAGEFQYQPADGCWAKLIMPEFFHDQWDVQTANPERPGDWMALRCMDGRVAFQPQSPNTKAQFFCGGRDAKEKSTFFFQGNAELFFKAR